MKIRLEGKVAIVVGAGTKGEGVGNGKAAAIQFAREGAKVLCVDRDEAAVRATKDMIQAEAGQAEICTADITNAGDCERIVETCFKRFNRLDVLHNNVGIITGSEITDTSEEDWDKTFNVNLKGMWLMCKYAVPRMIENGGGSIINVSSICAIRPTPPVTYGVSKGGVNTLTQYAARSYARYNIRVNAIMPGVINTPLVKPLMDNAEMSDAIRIKIPMERFATPWEVASVAAFLASDEASYITGVIIPVDGGISLTF